MMKLIIAESFGLMIVGNSLIWIIQQISCWQGWKKQEDIVDMSLEIFRKPLKLQGNVEEIKFSKLYAKGDFLQCVKEKCLFETLSWIDKSPFYTHYTNVNNLFYTLVEIFDSIMNPDEISEFGYDYFKMKSVFYV